MMTSGYFKKSTTLEIKTECPFNWRPLCGEFSSSSAELPTVCVCVRAFAHLRGQKQNFPAETSVLKTGSFDLGDL